MKCRHVRLQLAEYEEGLLGEADRMAVETHLLGCPACRSELLERRWIGELVSHGPVGEPARDLWPGVRSRLRPRAERARVYARRRGVLATAGAALAAAGLIAGVIFPRLGGDAVPLAAGYTPTAIELVAQWDQPMADDAALGLSLLLQDDGENGEVL